MGGVHQDLPPEQLIADIHAWCDPFLKVCDDHRGPADRQPHLQAAQRRHRRRSPWIEAFAWGLSGVMVRGTGVAWDLRRVAALRVLRRAGVRHPDRQERRLLRSLCYADGSRCAQSARIMKQCMREARLRRRAGAARRRRTTKIVPPTRGEMKRSMEALIHHFKLYTEGVPRATR
jgi:NADH-quinone oxidoreductase subunit D